METKKLTVRLPIEQLEFAKGYAREHRITVTELIGRYLRSLRKQTDDIDPEVRRFRGLVPRSIDAVSEHRQHLARKHRCDG